MAMSMRIMPLVAVLCLAWEPVLAQASSAFSDDQLNRYVQATSVIERRREDVLRRAKRHGGWRDVVQLAEVRGVNVCDLDQREQPKFLQDLCSELITYSEQELRRLNLSNREFNRMTQAIQRDPQLREVIQNRFIQLRDRR
jgi:ribosomal protein L25 (general stress protein Ctc)